MLNSVLFTALSRGRESANRIKCLSNVRSLAQGAAIYTVENRGHWPLPGVSLKYQRLNCPFITHEMHTGMRVGPDFVDATGAPNGKPIAPFFQCPSSPDSPAIQVTQWTDVSYPGNATSPGLVVTSSNWLLMSSYVHCANGYSANGSTPLGSTNTQPDKASTGNAATGTRDFLPGKLSDKGIKPLFADKTESWTSTGSASPARRPARPPLAGTSSTPMVTASGSTGAACHYRTPPSSPARPSRSPCPSSSTPSPCRCPRVTRHDSLRHLPFLRDVVLVIRHQTGASEHGKSGARNLRARYPSPAPLPFADDRGKNTGSTCSNEP